MSALASPRRTGLQRIVLAGGGTAGHVSPALAILGETDASFLWIGSTGGREESIVRRAGLNFVGVPTGAVVGRGPVALAGSGVRNLRGVMAARSILSRFRPDAVLATGGYVSVPVVLAARWLGIPSAIFLPDVEPGVAVKALARVADRVFCTTEVTRRYLPAEKLVATGYPVRSELREWASRPDARDAGRAALELPVDGPVLIVMGGSLGALSINQAVDRSLDALLERVAVVHLTGSDHIAAAEARRAQLDGQRRDRYRPFAFMHEELGAAMAAADLILCRSGASTLGELPAFGLPGVLVPGTFAGGHQRHNADYLVRAGAALQIEDSQLGEEETLTIAINRLLDSPDDLARMAAAARGLDRPDAVSRIVDALAALARSAR